MTDDMQERMMRLSGLTEPEEIELDRYQREWGDEAEEQWWQSLPIEERIEFACGTLTASMEHTTFSRIQEHDGVPF